MSTLAPNQIDDPENADSSLKSLYRVGGVAALIATILFLSDIVVMPALGSIPSTAIAWFTLLQTNKVVGILQLFFTDLIGVALMFPIFFALYAALRRANGVYAGFAAVLGLAGIAVVLATNSNYALINLSNQYAAATTEAQRSQLLAAGEAMLANTNGTGANMSNLLIEGAFVMISVIMLQDRSRVFAKGIAYLGILAHGFDVARVVVFLIFIPVFDTHVALAIGVPLLIIGGTIQLIWYPLVGRRLWQLGRE